MVYIISFIIIIILILIMDIYRKIKIIRKRNKEIYNILKGIEREIKKINALHKYKNCIFERRDEDIKGTETLGKTIRNILKL